MVLTLSDWYHDQMPSLLKHFVSYANPTGAEPVPDAALMNETQSLKIHVEPGKTYMFRIVNMAAFAAQYLWFEGHIMRIVEVDGIYTEAAEAEMIYVTPAQRYSVLVTTKDDTSSNFAIVGSMDQVDFSLALKQASLANVRIGSLRQNSGDSQPQCYRLARLQQSCSSPSSCFHRLLRTIRRLHPRSL